MTNSFYYRFTMVLILIIFLSGLNYCNGTGSDSILINPAENYPRWLLSGGYNTSQTSGITFLNESDDGTLQFLLADDIGKIHRFFVKDDTVFSFSEIKFSQKVIDYFSSFPKLDFEEIFYDKYSGDVYLTIEGNGEEYLSFHGIYELEFNNNDVFQDSIIGIVKLDFKPTEIFYKDLRQNIGYEGFTADENYFYLGLENVQTGDGNFSNHTIIRIADKKSRLIVKEISTENLEIATICGLYSDENYSIWGIDRNNKKVFKLNFDEYFSVTEIKIFDVKTVIPGYNSFEYVGSLESITIAETKFLFLVDDPWQTYFIPPDEILNQLNQSSINNFKKFIPVIYKFIIE